jgi:hypothetical protein
MMRKEHFPFSKNKNINKKKIKLNFPNKKKILYKLKKEKKNLIISI